MFLPMPLKKGKLTDINSISDLKNPDANIVIDKNNVIIAGHTRYMAGKRLKMKEVPTIIANDLIDEQVKAFRLADNKMARKDLQN